MLALLRQNPALRTLPRWLAVSGLTAAVVANVFIFDAMSDGRLASEPVIAILSWLALTVYLVFGEVWTRCTPFNMALPIPTRKLWLSHLAAVALSGVAILAATAGPIAGVLWVIWKLKGGWLVSAPGIGSLAAHVFAGFFLAVFILQSPDPARHRLEKTPGRAVFTLAVMAIILALVFVLHTWSPWTVLVTLALAVVTALHRVRSAPKVFELDVSAGAKSDPVARGTVAEQWQAAGAPANGLLFGSLLNRTILRCFYVGSKAKHAPVITAPILIAFGALFSGLDGYWLEEGSLGLLYVPMLAYTLLAFTAHPVSTVYLMDAFPVSRRRILNLLVFPNLLLLAIGCAAGILILSVLESARPPRHEPLYLRHDRDSGNYYLYVPRGALEISWDGELPTTVAPWGEEHPAWSRPLFKVGPVKLYSPYHTPPGCSFEFTAWQISRAVEKVFGQTIPADEIADRYLSERADGTAALETESLTIRADYPELRRVKKGGPLVPAAFSAAAALWLVSLTILIRTYRSGVSKKKRQVITVALMAGLMLIWLIEMLVAPITGLVYMDGFINVIDTLFDAVGRSVVATVLLWLAGALLLWAAYEITLKSFRRAEVTPQRETGCAL
jgi:hypothetical protein